ncbi:MAG: hypothetical protein VCA34_10770, partial [Roseibacillus sp.]
ENWKLEIENRRLIIGNSELEIETWKWETEKWKLIIGNWELGIGTLEQEIRGAGAKLRVADLEFPEPC